MQERKYIFGLSAATLTIILGATIKFALHMYMDPGYGFLGDEFYTIALSKHLAFGYVDLPPLVPLLVALSRALLGESLTAMHIFPALAGSFTLVFICLITREFGGKVFAIALSALGFIVVPIWLGLDSIFCYDSIDQMVLAAFLYVLARLLRTGNQKLWILLGVIAGIACNTKMTLPLLAPGFIISLLISKYRKDLLTPWPWLGGAICLLMLVPYLLWQTANGWPTVEYWTNYGTIRSYEAPLPEYLTNLLVYMNPLLLPLWLAGLYRIFRRFNGVDYSFFGFLFLSTLTVMFFMHSPARMLAELFMPLISAATVFAEELSGRVRWEKGMKGIAATYLLAVGFMSIPLSLPILKIDQVKALNKSIMPTTLNVKEFHGMSFTVSPVLTGRLGWEKLVQGVAAVYDELPPEERAVAGIYAEWYMSAGAIDQLGPAHGLPHAVSGSLTYYLWGPGYSWDVMIVVSGMASPVTVFFNECELKATVPYEYDVPVGKPYIYVCRNPAIPAKAIWKTMKSYR
jgi:hypothetical protein